MKHFVLPVGLLLLVACQQNQTPSSTNEEKMNYPQTRKDSTEPTLKRGIFWIQSDQCGHSEWNIAIGFAGEYLSRNCHERAESFSDRPEKGKYRSLTCWNLEYYHPSEVHPHTSAICMHTMFEQAPVSGLAITCMKTVLEHGGFYVIPFMLFLQRKAFYLLP